MSLPRLLERIRAEARKGEMAIDVAVYEEAGLDPSEPVLLGSGTLDSRVGIFGRDPGRNEVLEREPFIGKGGQLIREALGPHRVFWANTVPYKPLGNKAWSVKVKRRFLPMIREYLVEHWQGDQLITCGNVAFEWFGIADKALKPVLGEFWKRGDRYEATLDVELDGKRITLHPLPHPSPLNATWYPRFPALIRARLQSLRLT
ncbi:MAG: uracil-DNA glycosylase family protein [Planctomycetota bacterium]